MSSNKALALGFEFLDIEIIDHKKEPGLSNEKWNCDECSLFFLSKEKLTEHKSKHLAALEALKCQYCNKTLSMKSDSKECYAIRKCNTCEYKCTKCPLRFQRHSSLVNHEKIHLHLKKKNPILKRKSHVIKCEPEKVSTEKVTRKRHIEKIVPEKPTNIEKKGNEDANMSVSLSPKKRRKTLPALIHDEKLVSHDINDTVKTQKQFITTFNKTTDEKIHGANKQNNISLISGDSANTSSHDSIVNYKPFSCHVCGDNFASGDSLLLHIQSHGENVLKGFKCKHCSDEFDDIYKMQYHLAICPLAEDETALVKNIPPKLHSPVAVGLWRKKKGRPKKIRGDSLDESLNYDLTPSLSTRGSLRRRNTEYKPGINKISVENVFVDSNYDGMENLADDTIKEDPLGGLDLGSNHLNNSPVESYEIVEEEVAKSHSCPFPRCGIKFSREKALLCHMRNHADDFEDSYKCHKCDIPFDDIHSLRTHLNECKDIKEENEDNVSEPDYADEYNSTDKSCHTFLRKKGDCTCNVCGKTFASPDKLKRHLALHGSSNFICRICKDVFINQPLLDEHFLSKHPLKSPYHCEICNEDFISELFLTIHESEYHGELISSEPTNPTRTGSKTVSVSMTNVKRHSYCSTIANNRYKGKNCFWCPVCLASFDKKESMRTHFRTDHVVLTNSVYICEICNMEKPNAEMLSYHLEVHSGNLLSVNRFSILRACINDKGNKLNEIIKKKYKFKSDSNFASDIDEDSKLLNKTMNTKAKVTQKKLEPKNKTKKKSINKVKSGFKRMPKIQPLDSLLKHCDSEALSSSQPSNLSSNSNQLRKYKCTRNRDNCKLKIETVVRKSKINSNRNRSLAGKKRRKPYKNLRKLKTGRKEQSNDDFNTNSIACDLSTKDLTDNNPESTSLKKNGIFCSKSNLDDNNTIEERFACTSESKTIAYPSINNNEKQTECPKGVTTANMLCDETKIIESDSSNETAEEICCSMCSMSFYHQDELLDHVATHI